MLKYDLHIIKKEILNAINDLKLNLEGLTILTEIGTELFLFTPIICVLAGAEKVFAFTKTTNFGTIEEIQKKIITYSEKLNIDISKIKITTKDNFFNYNDIDIVTNLGHVRPIDELFLSKLKKNTVISYMSEAWEHRKEDLNLESCRKYNIKVVATNEDHSLVNCFRETGLIALNMIFDAKISIFDANVLIISRDKFGLEIKKTLNNYSKNVILYNNFENNISQYINNLDILIIADYLYLDEIVGNKGLIIPKELKENSPYVKIIQYCGMNNISEIKKERISIFPEIELYPIRMSKTLAEISYKSVIRLHTAGLKVGEDLFKNKKSTLQQIMILNDKYLK